MCGRAYSTFTEEELRFKYLNGKPVKIPDFKANYNFSPTQEALVLRAGPEGEKQLELMKWGLIPSWAKDAKVGYKMINARSETVAEKPSFKQALKQRRCIVPVSGFIEWKREGEAKKPHCIYLKNRSIMSLAGLWETWKNAGGQIVQSFTILTKEANPFMALIHDRMPVILNDEQLEMWISPALTDPSRLIESLAKPALVELMAHEVSPRVNSPRNNSKDVLEPLSVSM